MATRTGISDLDQLLDAFLAQDIELMDEDTVEDPPRWEAYSLGRISQMRDKSYSARKCGEVSDALVGWLQARGVDARTSDLEEGGAGSKREWHGYDDRPDTSRDWDDSHITVLVDHADMTYSIDLTASQYGYKEFPLVQRRAAGGPWQRDWDLAPALTPLDATAAREATRAPDAIEGQSASR